MYGLFSAVSVQKRVRDRVDGIPVTNINYGLSWISVLLCIVLMAAELWNGTISLPEKGFYGMAYLLSLFAALTVQRTHATAWTRLKSPSRRPISAGRITTA
jgi:uncharacterized membrane protein YiaA